MKSQSIFFLFLLIIFLASHPSHSATLGDYRTKASGNWNQSSIWEYYNGSGWVNATTFPTYTDDDIDIRSGYSVTVTTSQTIDQTSVSGTLNVNSGVTLTINDGSGTDLSVAGIVNVNGILFNNGTISSSADEMFFNIGSLYKHNYNGSNIAGATWNDGSTCEVTGITSSSSILNTDQSFYHFKWNCTSQTAETNCAGNLQTIRGNFTMASTGASGKLKLGESADYTLNITGNWDHQGGTLNMGGGSSYAFINLTGNFSMSGGKITELNSTGYTSRISFVKQGMQTYIKSAGTFENNVDFEIANGCTLDVGNSLVDGSLGLFSVNSGGTLKTAHVNGIALSGPTGSIQTTSRYFSFAGNYHYYATGPQATGNGIPSPLNGKLIIGSTGSATNLTLTNGSVSMNGTLILCSSSSSNSTIVSGTVVFGTTGTLEYQGLSGQTSTNKEWPVASSPPNVNINNGFGVIMNGDRTIEGMLTLSQGNLSIGLNTLTLNGALSKNMGGLNGGTGSNISLGGTSVTAIDLPDVTLSNLLLNRTSGVRFIGNVTIYGAMILTNGNVTLSPSKSLSYITGSRLKYNGSANQVTHAEEFPVSSGPPSLEIDKPAGTSLNLNFSRTLTENLFLFNGNLSLGSNTLTLNALITTTNGTLTGGNTSNLTFNGNGASTILPEVTLQHLTINRPNGIEMGGHITVDGMLTLSLGSLYLNDFTLDINGSIARSFGGLTGTELSTLNFGPADIPTIIPPVMVGYIGINRSSGIFLDGDVNCGVALTLTSGSLNIGQYILTINGSIDYSGGSLTGGSLSNLFISGNTPMLNLATIVLSTLTLDRPSGLAMTGDITIENALNLNSGNCFINGKHLLMNGMIQYFEGSLEGNSESILSVDGSAGFQTLESLTLHTLNINRPEGIGIAGNFQILNTLVLRKGNIVRNGWLLYGPAATLRYAGTSQQITTDEELPATNGPCNLSIINPAGVVLHDNRTIPGNVELTAGSFNLNDKTLSLCGTFIQLSGTLEGSVQSNIHFDPGPGPGVLPAVLLENLIIDRLTGVTTTGNCTVWGTLNLVNGYFRIGGTTNLNLMGQPIEGNTLNLMGSPFAGLYIGGSEPGWIIPCSLTEIGFLSIDNDQGVALDGDIIIGMRVSVSKALDMGDHVLSGSGMVKVTAGSRLISGHAEGISGNIQLTGPAMIDANVDYEFNGMVDQFTGFLPTNPPFTIRNLTICNTGSHNVTLNTDVTVSGNLEIAEGSKFTVDVPYVLTVETDVVVH